MGFDRLVIKVFFIPSGILLFGKMAQPNPFADQCGTSGSLDGDTLTLNGVPNVIYFSDRPARKAGHISLEKFVEMWDKGDDSFKADPPNATLSLSTKDGVKKHVVVELISVEQKGGSLVFKVAGLYGPSYGDLKKSTLFIDTVGEPTLQDMLQSTTAVKPLGGGDPISK